MSSDERMRFESVAGQLLRELDYEFPDEALCGRDGSGSAQSDSSGGVQPSGSAAKDAEPTIDFGGREEELGDFV